MASNFERTVKLSPFRKAYYYYYYYYNLFTNNNPSAYAAFKGVVYIKEDTK